jgi:transcriptional regulator with XRE-family HTH domain
MTFGQNLRAARKAKGLKMRDLGDLLGVSHVYVSHVESGKSRPMTEERLPALAKALGVKLATLVAWREADKCPTCGGWGGSRGNHAELRGN